MLKVCSMLECWQTSLGYGQGKPRPMLLWAGMHRQTLATGWAGKEEPQPRQPGGTKRVEEWTRKIREGDR